ncbi:hypothetical protein SCL_2489 [Sulfuricaulis limicola]|uniref:DUF1566 domain-containing protein n=1 Tax=Sulfuricaulis limicola TaxID=1620215 RepID=A0A1B4XIY6_9GAMM|nr:DUF1566 domain-containing protein [Sulfuricaulis limicola]BAV34766.1 hypothetical protein SCL_2489 [Sulfuricaulis limicola]
MHFHHRWAVTAIFVVALSASTIAPAASVSGQGTWETTLQARDFDGNTATIEGYYDTVLGITWLANAGYAQTSGYATYGVMNWYDATTWTANLNISGITGWRLPRVYDTGVPCTLLNRYGGGMCEFNVLTTSGSTVYSELASMYYDTLGNKALYDSSGNSPQQGWGLTNTGPFLYVSTMPYWTDTSYAPNLLDAWMFDLGDGQQAMSAKLYSNYFSWAVHSGDVGVAVSSVPVPAAAWLFGSGLIGLFGMAKRKVHV